MQMGLLGGWRLSIRVNKGRYSSCLNPHILVLKPYDPQYGVRSYGVSFPPDWRIWNIELDAKKRAFRRKMRRPLQVKRPIKKVAGFWKVSLFIRADGTAKFYWAFPFCFTQCVEWKSNLLRAAFYGRN